MKVAEIMYKYEGLVPFPITPNKIKRAGYDVTQYLTDLVGELNCCEDADDPKVRRLVGMIEQVTSANGRTQR